MKSFTKSLAFNLLANRMRIAYRLQRLNANKVLTILSLHRVAPDDKSAYQPLDPQLFKELVEFCKKHFTITTFHKLSQNINVSNKPLLILSFDDGYKDFIEYAMPIISAANIQVNHNIIPECVETGLPPFNVMLQDFIGKAPLELLMALDIPGFSLRDIATSRSKIGMKVSAHVKNKPMAEQIKLREFLLPQIHNYAELRLTPMMTLSDIQGVITQQEFGVHSYSHANMAVESLDYFQADLIHCKEYFQNKLQRDVDIYAFPNGSYNHEQLELAYKSGYKHLLLVNEGFTNPQTNAYNRITFHAQSKSEVIVRATGNLLKI